MIIKYIKYCILLIYRPIKRYFERKEYYLNYNKNMKNIKEIIIAKYSNSEDKEIVEILEYITNNNAKIFSYNYSIQYENQKNKIETDNDSKLFFIRNKEGKKIYFSKDLLKSDINICYNGICCEQDPKSPHYYYNNNILKRHYRKVLDLGAAEGNFSLKLVELSQEIILFECEENWQSALNLTFSPWKSKIRIVQKFVSDTNDEMTIRLDDYFTSIPDDIDLIKIDVEGYEINVLNGMKLILKKNPQVIILICAYHKPNDEENIKNFFGKEYNVIANSGYMLLEQEPYLRRGVLYISHK